MMGTSSISTSQKQIEEVLVRFLPDPRKTSSRGEIGLSSPNSCIP